MNVSKEQYRREIEEQMDYEEGWRLDMEAPGGVTDSSVGEVPFVEEGTFLTPPGVMWNDTLVYVSLVGIGIGLGMMLSVYAKMKGWW